MENGSNTGKSPKTIIAKSMREMARCLVLGNYFDEGETSTEDEADGTLLDELCAYISKTFFFIAEYDEDEEALTKLLHLARPSLDVYHIYLSPTWFESPSDRQTYMAACCVKLWGLWTRN